MPSYFVDLLRMLEMGLVGGISPGFAIPPASVVSDAERLTPEPGNSGVQVRVIKQAVLFELSLVTRPSYPETEVALRGDFNPNPTLSVRKTPRWL